MPEQWLAGDPDFESGIQALLDGQPLPNATGADDGVADQPLRVVDAIARASRVALFGSDLALERPAPKQWGHLELRAEIGRGANGIVYRAWDPRLAREVALKLLASDIDPQSALDEGRLLARLNHPHIVKVYGADTYEGTTGIWMELLDGDTVDEFLARDGAFGVEETLIIGLDLAGALAAVHSAGLLHRDIKARNVVRDRGGRIVLTDFGAGRGVDEIPRIGFETGTPVYMAPEVLTGGTATVRSDIYSLGVLLYRLLTGSLPVPAADVKGLRAAHAARSRVPLAVLRPDVDAETTAVIECASNADGEHRYASAATFEAALMNALQLTLARRARVVNPLPRVWLRWRKPAAGLAAVILMGLIVGFAVRETAPGRAARRALGLPVPPRSPLYLTLGGGLGVLRGRSFEIIPHNPGTALPIAVSSDLGVRTVAGLPPWTRGGRFRLDGTPIPESPVINGGLCCFYDGTTDGQFNYAPRADSTLLEPVGSRPLAPAALFRFARDWSKAEQVFLLEQDGTYAGVGYSRASDTFWLAKRMASGSVIEQWSREGERRSTPITLPAVQIAGLAVDPRDDTLWVVRLQHNAPVTHLENFNTTGRHLGSFDLEWPLLYMGIGGIEFVWTQTR
jgi:hypothetical protein